MVTTSAIMRAMRTIPDPEMPISIVDLGLIHAVRIEPAGGAARVSIDVLPTFVGCPALEMIAGEITKKVGALPGVSGTDVRFLYDPPWSVDRITADGRAALSAHGVTVPDEGSALPVPGHLRSADARVLRATGSAVEFRTSAIKCPFCGSDRTSLESMFGPTRCRMIYYCAACRNSFEHMKRV